MHHIRSTSTLIGMFLHPEDAHEIEERDGMIYRLTRFAQCLVRVSGEIVAIGLFKDCNKYTVLASHAYTGAERSTAIENAHRDDPEGLQVPLLKPGKDIDHYSDLVKFLYRYNVLNTRLEKRHAPDFPTHARNVFDLFQRCLSHKGRELEASSRRDVLIYVIGTSLDAFNSSLTQTLCTGEEANTPTLRAFLQSKCEQNFQGARGTFKIKVDLFSSVARHARLSCNERIRDDIEQGIFSSQVALLYHQILSVNLHHIFRAAANLKRLLQSSAIVSPPTEDTKRESAYAAFGERLEDLCEGLWCLTASIMNLPGVLNLYIDAIKRSPKVWQRNAQSATEHNTKDKNSTALDADAYLTWIAGITRQSQAIGFLTSLEQKYDEQMRQLVLVATEGKPNDTGMEPWEQILASIYKNQSEQDKWTGAQVQKYLDIITKNNIDDQDDGYQMLRDKERWHRRFSTAIHPEAMIASMHRKGHGRLLKIGVSEPCCRTCSVFLEHTVRFLSVARRKTVGFREPVERVWPWALPRDCSLNNAKAVADSLDQTLRETLEEALPDLKRRAEKHPSDADPGATHDKVARIIEEDLALRSGESK